MGFKMQMYTKTLSSKQYAEINNAKKWIDDKTGDVDMPFVECRDGEDEEFPFNQGTSFKLFFKDENVNKIKDLSWLGINTAESWNYVSKITYDLCVKDIRGKTTRIENNHAEFFYPHMFMKHTSIKKLNRVRFGGKNLIPQI